MRAVLIIAPEDPRGVTLLALLQEFGVSTEQVSPEALRVERTTEYERVDFVALVANGSDGLAMAKTLAHHYGNFGTQRIVVGRFEDTELESLLHLGIADVWLSERPVYLRQQMRVLVARQRALRISTGAQLDLRLVLQSTPVMCLVVDRQTNVLYVNFARNVTIEEVRGRSMLDFIHKDDYEIARTAIDAVFATGDTQTYVAQSKEGPTGGRWYRVLLGPLQQGSGITAVVVVVADIIEQTQVEAALARRDQVVSELLSNLPDAVIQLDSDLRAIFVNRQLETMLSLSADHFLGKTPTQTELPSAFANLWEASLLRARETRVPLSVELTAFDGIGETRWLETRIIPQTASTGAVDSLLSLFRDVTEMRDMQRQIETHTHDLERLVAARTGRVRELERRSQAQEQLVAAGRIAAGVAHEINNPLAGIKNAFSLIRTAVPADHKYAGFVDLIDKEIDRIRDIIKRMYELYAPARRQIRRVDVGRIMDELIVLLRNQLDKRALVVDARTSTDLTAAVRLPEAELRQVLFNLLLNAIQASPTGGTITINADLDKDRVRVRVTDRGKGIPAALVPRIFEPFFSTKRANSQGGMGLGLAVSHNLAAAVGGEITVQTTLNEGSTFTVILPTDGS